MVPASTMQTLQQIRYIRRFFYEMFIYFPKSFKGTSFENLGWRDNSVLKMEEKVASAVDVCIFLQPSLLNVTNLRCRDMFH